MRLLFLFLLLLGCQRESSQERTESDLTELKIQLELYKTKAPVGWGVSSSCDALLFVSLQAVGREEQFDIEAAEASPGQWFRNPTQVMNHEHCSSDISRDMIRGLMVYSLEFKRLDLLEQLWSYGSGRFWKMGQERNQPNTRTILVPELVGLLAEGIYYLGGESHPERFLQSISSYNTTPGYISHLSMLDVYMRSRMYGIGRSEVAALTTISAHMSENPLVWALLGNKQKAADLLRKYWPADRLPTYKDWSDEWRIQRSDGDSGLQSDPNASDSPHSGGDFMFTVYVLEK